MKKDIVAGLGEIGLPILKLISKKENAVGFDLNKKLMNEKKFKKFETLTTRFLHVAIPVNENFNLMIEKLEKQQDKLLTAERHAAWESVARKLAHEIKNPLTPIQLSIDRLREKYLKKDNNENNDFSN